MKAKEIIDRLGETLPNVKEQLILESKCCINYPERVGFVWLTIGKYLLALLHIGFINSEEFKVLDEWYENGCKDWKGENYEEEN